MASQLVLAPVKGARVGTACAGIKDGRSDDVVVIVFDKPATTAYTFTSNRFVAAPVTVAKKHIGLNNYRSSAWIINSGNANCGLGKNGMSVAQGSCAKVAKLIGAKPEAVLPFSTGVILEPLSAKLLGQGASKAVESLKQDNWSAAATAIMTTDTRPKGASIRSKVKGGHLTITGIAKGSGMIHPDMATMLAFMVSDAKLPAALLRKSFSEAVANSFNAISVDGDTSTNDAAMLALTGNSAPLTKAETNRFIGAMNELCQDLARQIVEDGEGATCTAMVVVRGLPDNGKCKVVANSVACSPLVKTMLHARDPNIGRLLMAVGKAGVNYDHNSLTLRINGRQAFRNGSRTASFTEEVAQGCFDRSPIMFDLKMGDKDTRASLTFTDLSAEYVRINSDYRS